MITRKFLELMGLRSNISWVLRVFLSLDRILVYYYTSSLDHDILNFKFKNRDRACLTLQLFCLHKLCYLCLTKRASWHDIFISSIKQKVLIKRSLGSCNCGLVYQLAMKCLHAGCWLWISKEQTANTLVAWAHINTKIIHLRKFPSLIAQRRNGENVLKL